MLAPVLQTSLGAQTLTNTVWVHDQLVPSCKWGPLHRAGRDHAATASAHLGVVSSGVLGHSTLLFHQEAEPPALLGKCCLVAVRHVVLQLALLVADGVDVLGAEGTGR